MTPRRASPWASSTAPTRVRRPTCWWRHSGWACRWVCGHHHATRPAQGFVAVHGSWCLFQVALLGGGCPVGFRGRGPKARDWGLMSSSLRPNRSTRIPWMRMCCTCACAGAAAAAAGDGAAGCPRMPQVVGVSFHVGSACKNLAAFTDAVEAARKVREAPPPWLGCVPVVCAKTSWLGLLRRRSADKVTPPTCPHTLHAVPV